ncbi:polysaccharide biosynthesis/export family protein [Leisingera daeponensis]|uniref:Polysaccharide biosynthesis/export family protein n=1 Tax=Leisingera daeponensis TaxID=405746 RepID=A0ABS7NI34_9RHOB|nr:polysaccharide biosynthesis/export family protein [Leisingera daeponensis]MBY6140860.1 polysaccharide biosynthesis/export family protein [Leisingera daeponensis]
MARRTFNTKLQARFAGVAVFVCLAAATAVAGSPALGPGDDVSISVLNREDLSRDYRIRPDGKLSLHVVGEVPAAGQTPAELEAKLEALLSDRTGLPASVAVSIARWRPVYALGDVVSPGEIAFREGLTVGRILAVSGGLYPRESETASSQLDIRIADERSKIAVRRSAMVDLHAQRLRLLAESSGAVELQPDAEFSALAGPEADQLIAEQLAILRSRVERDRVRAASAQTQADLAAREASALANQQAILREQIETSAKALKDLESLLDRGLTSTERVRQLRSIYNDENIELMLSASYEARARQAEVNLLASVEDARRMRAEDITAELARVMAAIRTEEAEIAASRELIRALSAALGQVPATGPLLPPEYRIRRNAGQGEQVLPAALDTEVLPGDLVEVRRGGFAVAEPG